MPEVEFQMNNKRYDPYKNFKFRIRWHGRYVAGMNRISGLPRRTDDVKRQKSPDQPNYEAITLERGVTHDVEFEQWASSARGNTAPPIKFRKDIVIELYNEAEQLAAAYSVYRCWVSEYTALPELDANSNAVAIESIKLENEGWERV